MELRRFSICMAFFAIAVISHCSEARHSVHRRASDYETSNEMMNDESNDYAQNDADGGNDADDDEPVAPAVIVTKPDTYRLLIGMSVRLECTVSPSENTVVSWTKGNDTLFIGNTKLKPSERYSLADGTHDLVIRDLDPEDTGRYTCEILQVNPVRITHVVIVEEPPRITNPEITTGTTIVDDNAPRIVKFEASETRLHEGSDLLLTCTVTGSPKPSIIWSRQRHHSAGTEPLRKTNDGEFSENTVFLKNVTADDAGIYYCYAVSGVGNATAQLKIVVTGKPRVHVHRPVVNSDIGIEAVLQCTVVLHDESEANIRWFKDDEEFHRESSSTHYSVTLDHNVSTLTITPQRDEDFGTYTCHASNPEGDHEKSIDLVQSPVIESLDVEGPKLSWTVHSHQPLEDIEVHLKQFGGEGEWKTFKVPLPDMKESRHKYELIYALDDSALEAGSYEATVKVKNSKAWSQHSEPAVVQLVNQAEPIQTASVFRGADGNSAHSMQSTLAVISTTLMYLLVRML